MSATAIVAVATAAWFALSYLRRIANSVDAIARLHAREVAVRETERMERDRLAGELSRDLAKRERRR